MSFCPHCGAATTHGMSFCTACGENLPTVPTAPSPTGQAATDPMRAWAGRPVGKRVKPIVVVLLTLVTVSLYALFFWWRTTRETDAYAGSSSHGPARIGVLLVAVGTAAAIGAGLTVFSALDWEGIAEERVTMPTGEELQASVEAQPVYVAGMALNALGTGILLVGLWRMWSAIRDDEARRGRRETFDPRLATAILGAGIVMTLVNAFVPMPMSLAAALGLVGLAIVVGTFIVYYQTQARLNEMWDAALSAP